MFLLHYLLVSLLLLVSSVKVSANTVGEDVKTNEENCTQIFGASKEDLIRLHDKRHLGDSKATKCMVACVLDRFETFDDQGAPNMTRVNMYIEAQFKPQDYEKVKKIWIDCFTAVTRAAVADHCDYVFQLVQCETDEVIKENIEKVTFWKVQN